MPTPISHPAGLFEQIPEDLPLEVFRRAAIRHLREAADWFRRVQAAGGVGSSMREVHDRQELCARYLIEAHARGLIPVADTLLNQVIAFHADPHAPVPDGPCTFVRCPQNLFHDLRGGMYLGADAGGNFDPAAATRAGGWMPLRSPRGFLNQPQRLQDADTCGVLADLLGEHGPAPVALPAPGLAPDQFDFGNGLIGQGFTPQDLLLLGHVSGSGAAGLSLARAREAIRTSRGPRAGEPLTAEGLTAQLHRTNNKMRLHSPRIPFVIETVNGRLLLTRMG